MTKSRCVCVCKRPQSVGECHSFLTVEMVTKRRTVVTFGLAVGPRVSEVSTVTGIGGSWWRNGELLSLLDEERTGEDTRGDLLRGEGREDTGESREGRGARREERRERMEERMQKGMEAGIEERWRRCFRKKDRVEERMELYVMCLHLGSWTLSKLLVSCEMLSLGMF